MRALVARVWFVIRETVTRWSRNDGQLLASSMAYYTALSFFPLLLVLTSALGFALRFSAGAQNAQQQLIQMLERNTDPHFAASVKTILAEVKGNAAIGGPLGLITLLFSSLYAFAQLDSGFARIWHEDADRPHGYWSVILDLLTNRLKALLVLVGLGIVLVLLFFANMALSVARQHMVETPLSNWGFGWLQFLAMMLINALVFATLYKVLPHAAVRWRDALAGGVFVSIVWEIGRQVLAYFIVRSNYGAYGVIGAFLAVMVWVYYASILLFLGAQMVQVLGDEGSQTGNAESGMRN